MGMFVLNTTKNWSWSSRNTWWIWAFLTGVPKATNTWTMPSSSWTSTISIESWTTMIVINWYVNWYAWYSHFGQWVFIILARNNPTWYIELYGTASSHSRVVITADFTNNSISIATTITWSSEQNWSLSIQQY